MTFNFPVVAMPPTAVIIITAVIVLIKLYKKLYKHNNNMSLDIVTGVLIFIVIGLLSLMIGELASSEKKQDERRKQNLIAWTQNAKELQNQLNEIPEPWQNLIQTVKIAQGRKQHWSVLKEFKKFVEQNKPTISLKQLNLIKNVIGTGFWDEDKDMWIEQFEAMLINCVKYNWEDQDKVP